MLTMVEELKIFKSWGMDNATIAKYVGWNAITPAQYEEITGVSYDSVEKDATTNNA